MPPATNQQVAIYQHSKRGGEMNRNKIKVVVAFHIPAIILFVVFITSSAGAQMPNGSSPRVQRPRGTARSAFPWPLMPESSLIAPAGGPSLQVIGGGTLGRITKRTGFTGANSLIGAPPIF